MDYRGANLKADPRGILLRFSMHRRRDTNKFCSLHPTCPHSWRIPIPTIPNYSHLFPTIRNYSQLFPIPPPKKQNKPIINFFFSFRNINIIQRQAGRLRVYLAFSFLRISRTIRYLLFLPFYFLSSPFSSFSCSFSFSFSPVLPIPMVSSIILLQFS